MKVAPRRAAALATGLAIVGLVWLAWPNRGGHRGPRGVGAGHTDASGGAEDSASDEGVTNSIGMKFVRIEPGEFMMGSPPGEDGPNSAGFQQLVRITEPFLLGVHEVTQEQWEQVVAANPSLFTGRHFPVEQVAWDEAVEFCRKLSEEEGKSYRLPTEAEWEYACRAGTTTAFSFGDRAEDLHRYGNYCDKSNRDGFPWVDMDHDDRYARTAPVGSYESNPWGLHDMHGNVLEWCQDERPDAPSAPAGESGGLFRSVRGGCWSDDPGKCRSAYRLRCAIDSRSMLIGFRIVLDVSD